LTTEDIRPQTQGGDMVTPSAESERTSVKAALDAFVRAVERHDLDGLSGLVAQDPDLVWIGTGEDEWIVGYEDLKEAIRAQNEALDYIRISVSEETIHLSLSKQVAWATNRWVFRARMMGGEELALPLRCTWVAEKRDGGWVLVHSHKSVGAAA
jgi:ketosteroid isomerase-like protein